MSNTAPTHRDHHKDWLAGHLSDRQLTPVEDFEYVSPTYVIRVSTGTIERERLGYLVRRAFNGFTQGLDIQYGDGFWQGTWESSVTVTVQAERDVYEDVLARLATVPTLGWAHIERHHPVTQYVHLNEGDNEGCTSTDPTNHQGATCPIHEGDNG